MKKLGKRLLILVIIVGVLYAAYMLFVMPGGYTDKDQLVTDFFTNINDSNACDTYFSEETMTYCDGFTELFDGESVVVLRTVNSGATIIATVQVGTNSEEFTVSFISKEVTGMKSFFNAEYYYIDIIE